MIDRGLRNNNPGNLELNGSTWQGLSSVQTDGRFCQFTEIVYGCRALIKTLITYVRKRKCRTIRDIINRWAPSNENNTESYIKYVSKYVNQDPNMGLPFKQRPHLFLEIARAIANYENGEDDVDNAIPMETWEKALAMAINK